MNQNLKKRRMRNLVVGAFLATPILASLISAIHLIDFFDLGNNSWMSYVLAITFELGSIASFVSLGVLKKVKKWAVISIFVILLFMQLAGNVYYVFDYVNQKLAVDPKWLDTFIEMVRPLYDSDSASDYKFVLAMLIGIAIPLVSILFLKSLVDYLSVEDDEPLPQPAPTEGPQEAEAPTQEAPTQDENLDDSVSAMEDIRGVEKSMDSMPESDDFDAALYENTNK